MPGYKPTCFGDGTSARKTSARADNCQTDKCQTRQLPEQTTTRPDKCQEDKCQARQVPGGQVPGRGTCPTGTCQGVTCLLPAGRYCRPRVGVQLDPVLHSAIAFHVRSAMSGCPHSSSETRTCFKLQTGCVEKRSTFQPVPRIKSSPSSGQCRGSLPLCCK